jgi:hypothetical protein
MPSSENRFPYPYGITDSRGRCIARAGNAMPGQVNRLLKAGRDLVKEAHGGP